MSPRSEALSPTDPDGTFLEVPTGRVHVVVEGPADGPVCVLVHGAPGSARDFRYLGPQLAARGLRSVRVDMPGFGQTPHDVWPQLDARGRAAFLWNVGRRFAPRFSLVGHSIGGAPCLVAAGLYPGDVSALALVNSVGVTRHRGMRIPEQLARVVEGALTAPAFGDSVATLLRETLGGLGFRKVDVEQLSLGDLRVHMGLVGALDFTLHRAAARQVTCPTLVASSEDDPLVEPRVSHALADALAGGPEVQRHLHLATGGHYLQKHAAGEIAMHLAEMLVGVSSSPPCRP